MRTQVIGPALLSTLNHGTGHNPGVDLHHCRESTGIKRPDAKALVSDPPEKRHASDGTGADGSGGPDLTCRVFCARPVTCHSPHRWLLLFAAVYLKVINCPYQPPIKDKEIIFKMTNSKTYDNLKIYFSSNIYSSSSGLKCFLVRFAISFSSVAILAAYSSSSRKVSTTQFLCPL